jgi:hypothetical protein
MDNGNNSEARVDTCLSILGLKWYCYANGLDCGMKYSLGAPIGSKCNT